MSMCSLMLRQGALSYRYQPKGHLNMSHEGAYTPRGDTPFESIVLGSKGEGDGGPTGRLAQTPTSSSPDC